MKAAITILKTKRPVSGEVLGERIVCASINRAKYDPLSKTYVQSFHPRYRIQETGDYTQVTKKELNRFKQRVGKWFSITEFVQS